MIAAFVRPLGKLWDIPAPAGTVRQTYYRCLQIVRRVPIMKARERFSTLPRLPAGRPGLWRVDRAGVIIHANREA